MKYLSRYKLFESNSGIINDISDILLPIGDLGIKCNVKSFPWYEEDFIRVEIGDNLKKIGSDRKQFLWKDVKDELSHLISFVNSHTDKNLSRIVVTYNEYSKYHFYDIQELDSIGDNVKIIFIEVHLS